MKYRSRIYTHYSSARSTELAPESIEGLASRMPYVNQMIKNWFPKNKSSSILEIGCGHGAIIYFANKAGYTNTLGVDGSEEQVNGAKKLGIDNVIHQDLIEHLKSRASSSIDCVIAFDVVEHFTRDELVDLIDLIRNVLKPGGRWIIHAPNAESPFSSRMLFGDFTHEMSFTCTSINQILLSSGFTDICCVEDQPIAHGVKSGIRLFFWKVIRSVLRFYIAVETGDTAKNAIFSQNFLVVATKSSHETQVDYSKS